MFNLAEPCSEKAHVPSVRSLAVKSGDIPFESDFRCFAPTCAHAVAEPPQEEIDIRVFTALSACTTLR